MEAKTDSFGSCRCVSPEVCGKHKRCVRRDEAIEKLLAPVARGQRFKLAADAVDLRNQPARPDRA